MTAPIARNPAVTLSALIDTLADRFGDAPALISEHQSLTFRGLAERASQYARWALRQGLSLGDVVCLLMPNCPEYMAIWLGITHVGGIVSLLNTNLVGDTLLHAINIVGPRHVIVDVALAEAFVGIEAGLLAEIQIWTQGGSYRGLSWIDDEIAHSTKTDAPISEYRAPTIFDRALYIYTSGTTGLPKAANVSHFRLMQWSHWFAGMLDTHTDDRMYNCLPMYHSIGGVAAIGSMLVNGGSVVLRERFSASRFWDDVVESKCTMFQYIGELCRYLVNAPENPRQRAHRLRLCCGNGLRADVWEKFQNKFAIPRILEFYAATEGNFSLYNVEGKVGAIGRVPSYLSHRFPLALVKYDAESGEAVRDKNGFCVRCAKNESGEAIGLISNGPADAGGEFEGYTDATASDQKILRGVFAPGDAWYRTGDLMRMDDSGFYYFVDRIGDTFRWKGENVSTSEVAAAIAAFPGVKEVNVYAVRVPRTEGAAGMAALVVEDQLDLHAFRRHVIKALPPYARPPFLRLTERLAATSTFKQTKADLQRQGFDPAMTGDPLYFNDPAKGKFVTLDLALHAYIAAGKVRL
jgi:fatty-acyl-CoA synthase